MTDRLPGNIGRRALLKSAGVAASAVVVGLSSIGLGRKEDMEAFQTEDEGPAASEVDWHRDYGGDRGDDLTLRHLDQTDEGGYAAAGDAATSAESGATADRFVLVKAAPDGTKQWETAAPDDGEVSGDAHVTGVVQTGDGGFAVVGRLEPRSERQSDAGSGRLGVAIKIDGEGETEWVETVGTGDDESRVTFADCAPAGADGGVVACGSDGARAWIAKFSAAGDIEWENSWAGDPRTGAESGTSAAEAGSVTARDDGGYLLFTRQGTAKRGEYFSVTVDGSGTVERRVVLDVRPSRTPFDHDLTRTVDGGYVYTGRDGERTTLTALGPDGDELWHRAVDDLHGGPDGGIEVRRTSDGGLAIGGVTSPADADGPTPAIVKTDAAGEKQWRRRFGDSGQRDVDALVETDDSGYAFLAGNTLTKLTPDDVPASEESDTPAAGTGSGPADATATRDLGSGSRNAGSERPVHGDTES